MLAVPFLHCKVVVPASAGTLDVNTNVWFEQKDVPPDEETTGVGA